MHQGCPLLPMTEHASACETLITIEDYEKHVDMEDLNLETRDMYPLNFSILCISSYL